MIICNARLETRLAIAQEETETLDSVLGKRNIHHYFPENDQEKTSFQWITHPFSEPDNESHDNDFARNAK